MNCEGDGVIRIEMNFLPDVYVPCDECHAKRYDKETLGIRYKGKNISDVLEIGKIVDLKKNSSMFSFTIGFINGSFRNVCLHYNSDNKTLIRQKAKKLHRIIEGRVLGSKKKYICLMDRML